MIRQGASNNLKKQFTKAREFLSKFSSALLVTHEFTDGDDLGGVLALGRILDGMGKKTFKVARGGVPDNLLFLPDHGEVFDHLPENFRACEVLVTLGCGDLNRSGFSEFIKWTKPILNIDHHPDTQMFGTVNVWEPMLAANCELLFLMFQDWGVMIDKFTAQDLLAGIFADTAGFQHSNVSSLTFEIAAELLRKGAKLELISRFISSHKELPKLRAWAVALENARFDRERKMVYTVITTDELAKVGAQEEDLEGVAELLNTIPEARFSMLLKQRGDEIKGSLRSEPSKGVDVSQIARSFGGGGHKHAAGFKFKGKIEKTENGWKIT